MPGGAIESGEFSTEALVREMREELGVTVEIGRLVWVVENLFEYRGAFYTEFGFYYEAEWPLPPASATGSSSARNPTSSSAGSG